MRAVCGHNLTRVTLEQYRDGDCLQDYYRRGQNCCHYKRDEERQTLQELL
jgi:hypothetical protein